MRGAVSTDFYRSQKVGAVAPSSCSGGGQLCAKIRPYRKWGDIELANFFLGWEAKESLEAGGLRKTNP